VPDATTRTLDLGNDMSGFPGYRRAGQGPRRRRSSGGDQSVTIRDLDGHGARTKPEAVLRLGENGGTIDLPLLFDGPANGAPAFMETLMARE